MSVRIGAGRLKGRRLSVGRAVRPTEAKVRAAFFDILGPVIAGADFLDLFAGTGAMGLEAWSRGAARALLVESDPRLAARASDAARTLAGPEIAVITASLPEQWPRVASRGPWDVVFADPPYRFERFADLLALVGPCVRRGGVVCVEHARGATLPERATGLGRTSERRYGESCLTFYERVGTSEGGASTPASAASAEK